MQKVKEQIKNELTTRIVKEIKKREENMVHLIEQANDAPGAMESHSDTTKSQLSAQIMEQDVGIQSLRAGLKSLKELKMRACEEEQAKAGSLVKASQNGKIRWYMLLPVGGGEHFELPELGSLAIITPGTPLGEIIFGSIPGEERKFNGQSVLIEEIR